MKFSVRGLAGIVAIATLAGCPVVTTPGSGTGNGTRPVASPGTQASPGAKASPTASASPSGTQTGSSGECAAVTENDANNDFAVAQALGTCSTVTGSIVSGNDDFFLVTLPAGTQDGRLEVTVTESSGGFTPGVMFYNSAKTELSSEFANDSTTSPFKSTQDVTAGKSYYVKLHNGGESANYTMRVEFKPVTDAHERNDSFDTAKALTSGQTVPLVMFAGAETNDASDVDYFKVEVPSGKTQIEVKIANKSTSEEGQTHGVTLYGADKSDLGAEYASGAQADLSHTFDVEAAGTYYLKVHNAVNSAVASDFTVTVK